MGYSHAGTYNHPREGPDTGIFFQNSFFEILITGNMVFNTTCYLFIFLSRHKISLGRRRRQSQPGDKFPWLFVKQLNVSQSARRKVRAVELIISPAAPAGLDAADNARWVVPE